MNVVHDSVCMEPVAQRKKNQWIAAAERVSSIWQTVC